MTPCPLPPALAEISPCTPPSYVLWRLTRCPVYRDTGIAISVGHRRDLDAAKTRSISEGGVTWASRRSMRFG